MKKIILFIVTILFSLAGVLATAPCKSYFNVFSAPNEDNCVAQCSAACSSFPPSSISATCMGWGTCIECDCTCDDTSGCGSCSNNVLVTDCTALGKNDCENSYFYGVYYPNGINTIYDYPLACLWDSASNSCSDYGTGLGMGNEPCSASCGTGFVNPGEDGRAQVNEITVKGVVDCSTQDCNLAYSFGNWPAGKYTLEWVSGALGSNKIASGERWGSMVAPKSDEFGCMGKHGLFYSYNNGNAAAPWYDDSQYSSKSEAEQHYDGEKVNIQHSGGQIRIGVIPYEVQGYGSASVLSWMGDVTFKLTPAEPACESLQNHKCVSYFNQASACSPLDPFCSNRFFGSGCDSVVPTCDAKETGKISEQGYCDNPGQICCDMNPFPPMFMGPDTTSPQCSGGSGFPPPNPPGPCPPEAVMTTACGKSSTPPCQLGTTTNTCNSDGNSWSGWTACSGNIDSCQNQCNDNGICDALETSTNCPNDCHITANCNFNLACDAGETGINCLHDCAAAALCGNGVKDGTETCDDGNVINGDGCNSSCGNETCGDWILTTSNPTNSYIFKTGTSLPEQCDDGNSVNNDACDNTCKTTTNCIITGASWDRTKASEGDRIRLIANASGCNGKAARFVISEYNRTGMKDSGMAIDLQPSDANFNNNIASTEWTAEWHDDSGDTVNHESNPEYHFNVSVVDSSIKTSALSDLVEVSQLVEPGCDQYKSADACVNFYPAVPVAEMSDLGVNCSQSVLCGANCQTNSSCSCYWDSGENKCKPLEGLKICEIRNLRGCFYNLTSANEAWGTTFTSWSDACNGGGNPSVGYCTLNRSIDGSCEAGNIRNLVWKFDWSSQDLSPAPNECRGDGKQMLPCPVQLGFESYFGIIILFGLLIIFYLYRNK